MQKCTCCGNKCKRKTGDGAFYREKCRNSTITGDGKTQSFTDKIASNSENKRIRMGILCEISKMKNKREKLFVQKAGVAVFPVKIAKKC